MNIAISIILIVLYAVIVVMVKNSLFEIAKTMRAEQNKPFSKGERAQTRLLAIFWPFVPVLMLWCYLSKFFED